MKYFLYILAGAALFTSCSKKLEVEAPTLEINIDPSRLVADTFTYKLGDTTRFMFSGYADNIAFYPGIAGYKYENRDRITGPPGAANMQFTSYRQWGGQANTLRILASNSLTGLDSTTVVDHAWTDITSRATLSAGTDNTASGIINLSDIAQADKPLYIAFRYNGVTGSTQRTWTIKNWAVRAVTSEGVNTVADLTTAAWTVYGNVQTPANAKWIATTSQIQVVGGGGAAPTNESWIITKPLNITAVTPDISIPVKAVGSGNITGYEYKYPAAGTYKAVFQVLNNTVKEQQLVLKEFWIKVVP